MATVAASSATVPALADAQEKFLSPSTTNLVTRLYLPPLPCPCRGWVPNYHPTPPGMLPRHYDPLQRDWTLCPIHNHTIAEGSWNNCGAIRRGKGDSPTMLSAVLHHCLPFHMHRPPPFCLDAHRRDVLCDGRIHHEERSYELTDVNIFNVLPTNPCSTTYRRLRPRISSSSTSPWCIGVAIKIVRCCMLLL